MVSWRVLKALKSADAAFGIVEPNLTQSTAFTATRFAAISLVSAVECRIRLLYNGELST